MIANFVILGFVVFMAYWWGQQGLFSAVLHLGAVIIGGALAIALWEPLTLSVFIKVMPDHAWGIGLLLPFVLFLRLTRFAFDKLIKANVFFSSTVNMVGGGILGAFSGILAAGICLISLGFLSLGVSLGGYQPYLLGPDGKIAGKPGGSLWIPADVMATNFFEKVSAGSFSNQTPLKYYFPEMARHGGSFRMHADGNAMLVAVPGSVELGTVYTAKTPLRSMDDSLIKAIGDKVRQANRRVVVIDTIWKFTYPTYNSTDNTLRVSPTQIQLVTRPKGDMFGERKIYTPIGVTKLTEDGRRLFTPFNDAQTVATATNPQQDSLGWVFVIETDERPQDLFVRRLRLQVPSFKDKAAVKRSNAQTGTIIGSLNPSSWKKFNYNQVAVETSPQGETPDGSVGGRQGIKTGSVASAVSVSALLPHAFSKNRVTGPLDLTKDNMIKTANILTPHTRERVSPANAIKGFYLPKHKAMIKVTIDRDAAQSLLGRTRVTAAMVQAIYITDNHGNKWQPTAYAWVQDKGMNVVKDPGQPLQYAKQLPIADMRKNHQLYVYFTVDRNLEIVAYNVGSTKQDVRLVVPK